MSHLQDIQTDAYDKLCQVGPQRWSRAHCPLVRYNYLTSNSVESVNACTVVYRKLPVLKLAETYRARVQEWYYQRRKLTGFFGVSVTKLTTGRLVNGSSCDGIDMVIKDLDLELKSFPMERIEQGNEQPNSMERATVLHQPDGVGSKWCHIVPYRELDGIPVALVASDIVATALLCTPDTVAT
nr:transposase, MuDR, MULE transposase domain protein [Tanacetum cinerariifolium]